MSVHGEYARALASLLERLADCAPSLRDRFRPALAEARVTAERDLSTAARSARDALDALEAAIAIEDDPPEPEIRLREACEHLQAHIAAILGPRRSHP